VVYVLGRYSTVVHVWLVLSTAKAASAQVNLGARQVAPDVVSRDAPHYT
jgi:hypothetical protein